jgi:outer membrane biosynthesis protein TonB
MQEMPECTNARMQGHGAPRRAILHFCILALLAFLSSGCATATAKSAAESPALEVPPPPPRTIEHVDTEPPPPATLPDEPSRPAPAAPPRRPPPPTREAPKTEPPVAPPPPADAKPAEPPKTLQTTSAEEEGREDQQIRALLQRASNDLKRIDYRRLSVDARTQYDTAKRFVTQAENALRAKNLVFARTVADKAAALAAQLAGK